MAVTRWPRELWDRALEATQHRLAHLCPLCPYPDGLTVTVDGLGDFSVPAVSNARGFTITVPQDARESVVMWEPCGHTVVVDDRLVPPLDAEEVPNG